MYHLRLSGRHYDMGLKRGMIIKKCGVKLPLDMDGFQMKHGRESEEVLRRRFPEVCEEMHGVCDAAGLDYERFASWMLAMGCCMYNLRNNVPETEVRGCTAFSFSKGDMVFYGRNNDLPPFLKEGSKSEIYRPYGGHKFNITTSSFINGEEGLNDAGLVVAMTFVGTRTGDIRPGFNTVFLVRYLLEKAGSVKEALDLISPVEVASNGNILLCDSTGEMVVVECSPKEKNLRRAEVLENGVKAVCTVNSFTSENMRHYQWEKEETYRSEERYSVVLRALGVCPEKEVETYIEDLLKGKYGFTCQYEKRLNFETIWSSVFDLKTRRIYRAEGDPRKKPFVSDERMV